MLNPKIPRQIENFILVKYTKHFWDTPKHVEQPDLREWNDNHEMMFNMMLEQLNFFYPKANIHVLTNEKKKNVGNIVWHYRPELEENHGAKLELYGLINEPAMYIDSDILIIKPFEYRHLITKYAFNIFQSADKSLQRLTKETLEKTSEKQYNCGLIWIARPNKQIVCELKKIKKQYFNDKEFIESNKAWFNNDEHPVSYFISKYNLKMNLFKDVNAFRINLKKEDVFKMQTVHYTGVKHKKKFVQEYRELCQARIRIFS